LKKTPLFDEHVKLGAKIVEFGGWEMPVYYSNVIDEHNATRNAAGLFDICHMGEFFVEGKYAFDFLQKVITNDLGKLEDGKAFYTVMCLENGGVIDDLFVYRFNKNRFMLVVNAGNIEKDFKWLMSYKDFFEDVVLLDKTNLIAKLDLQGPRAEEILQKLTNTNLKELKRFHFVEGKVNLVNTIISRTGYTAEDGFELYFTAEQAANMWNKLLEAGKEFDLQPVGLGARDTLRIEAGYSLYGHELNENINPFEAGIGMLVKLDKGDFIGKEALAQAKADLMRKIIAFKMLEKGIPRQGYGVYKYDKEIGEVTSGTMSPTFKQGLGMALINLEEAEEGNLIGIKIRDNFYKAMIVERPIYKFKARNI